MSINTERMYRYVQTQMPYVRTSLMLTDAICSNMAFVGAFFWVKSHGLVTEEVVRTNFYALWVLFNLVSVIAALHLRLYARSTLKQLNKLVYATWKSVVTLLLVFMGCTLIEHRFLGVGYFLGALAGMVIAYVILSRFLLAYIYAALSRRHSVASYKK